MTKLNRNSPEFLEMLAETNKDLVSQIEKCETMYRLINKDYGELTVKYRKSKNKEKRTWHFLLIVTGLDVIMFLLLLWTKISA